MQQGNRHDDNAADCNWNRKDIVHKEYQHWRGYG
jgi:hypothetical protein